MVRFMGRAVLLCLAPRHLCGYRTGAVRPIRRLGRLGRRQYGPGRHDAGAGVAAAGAGSYNQQTAVARSINANTAMQVNQYMYEVNKNNAKYYYARSANKQKEASSTGEDDLQAPARQPCQLRHPLGRRAERRARRADQPQHLRSGRRLVEPARRLGSRQEHRVRVRRQHDRHQPGRLQRTGVPDYLMTTPDFAPDRTAAQGNGRQGPETNRERGTGLGRDAGELPRDRQGSERQGRQPFAAGRAQPARGRQLPEGTHRPIEDARRPSVAAVPHGPEQGATTTIWAI